MATTNYDKLKQAAMDMKNKQIDICRHYLEVAKDMNLTPNSATVRSWTFTLEEWQELPIYIVMQDREAIAAPGLTSSEAEEVLANL